MDTKTRRLSADLNAVCCNRREYVQYYLVAWSRGGAGELARGRCSGLRGYVDIISSAITLENDCLNTTKSYAWSYVSRNL